MAIVAGDWEITRSSGNIRYIGGDHDNSPTYATVIEFHRWLQNLADDATASGNDELDITNTDPSRRSTDNIITLINGYNITSVEAEHLYDGSIIQNDGDDIWDGIVNFGNAAVQIQIIQNGAIIADDFWNFSGAGLNADAAAGISHRFMVKVKNSGTDIDNRKLIGICRRYKFNYSEFSINGTSRGNNVFALSDASDLNNTTDATTVDDWTEITNTLEGYSAIDVNNDDINEHYYSEWDRDTYTINQFYERIKWLSKDPTTEDACVDTGSDIVVDDATITGTAQSFTIGVNNTLITKATINLKIGAGTPTGNVIASIFSHSGSFGTSSVPNVIVGSASDAIDSTILTTTYQKIIFNFATPVPVSASTNYCLVITHADGSAGNYIHAQGDATGTHAGNRAHDTAGWAADAAEDMAFSVYTAPNIYGLPGNLFRGITHQVAITDLTSGNWSTPELLSWPTGTGQLLAIDNETSGSATVLWMQLLTGIIPATNTITGATNGATGTAGTVTERTINKPFCGVSTGSAIIGAYGIGIQKLDLTSSDRVTSLEADVITPPNYVINTLSGLISGEDRVLVGPWNGSATDSNGDPAITKDQLSLSGNLTTDNIIEIIVAEAIPSDTPATGYIRVTDDNGFERRLHYSAWTTSTFTIDTTDGNEDFNSVNATSGNNVYIAYIDELAGSSTASFTSVQSGTRQLVVIVRDGESTPIKQFISSWSQTSSNGTITAIRTTDA